MCVRTLRHALARLGRARDLIPLDKSHLFEMVGKHARGEETGDAAAGNYGMVKRTAQHAVPSTSYREASPTSKLR
jgi:hypothetical protein